MRKSLRNLSNSAKCVAGWPLQRIIFGHNGLYLWHLSFGGCGLPNIFRDWKYASTLAYCRLGRPLWVAVLPDNWHPYS